jgi:hypothetical protein
VRTLKSIRVNLEGGGYVALTFEGDALELSPADRSLVFELVDRMRSRSAAAASSSPPWPTYQPHPDDDPMRNLGARCYVCGQERGAHGSAVLHCPPFEITAAAPLPIRPEPTTRYPPNAVPVVSSC